MKYFSTKLFQGTDIYFVRCIDNLPKPPSENQSCPLIRQPRCTMVIYTMGGGNGLSFNPVIAMYCIAIRHEVHVDVIKTHFTGPLFEG